MGWLITSIARQPRGWPRFGSACRRGSHSIVAARYVALLWSFFSLFGAPMWVKVKWVLNLERAHLGLKDSLPLKDLTMVRTNFWVDLLISIEEFCSLLPSIRVRFHEMFQSASVELSNVTAFFMCVSISCKRKIAKTFFRALRSIKKQ